MIMNESDITYLGKISNFSIYYSPHQEDRILMGRKQGETKFIVGSVKNLNEYQKILEGKFINKRIKL